MYLYLRQMRIEPLRCFLSTLIISNAVGIVFPGLLEPRFYCWPRQMQGSNDNTDCYKDINTFLHLEFIVLY